MTGRYGAEAGHAVLHAVQECNMGIGHRARERLVGGDRFVLHALVHIEPSGVDGGDLRRSDGLMDDQRPGDIRLNDGGDRRRVPDRGRGMRLGECRGYRYRLDLVRRNAACGVRDRFVHNLCLRAGVRRRIRNAACGLRRRTGADGRCGTRVRLNLRGVWVGLRQSLCTSGGRVQLAVVRAADRQCEFRFRASSRIVGDGHVGDKRGGIYGDTSASQPAEAVEHGLNSTAALAIEIDGRMVAVGEDAANEPGEDGAGAHFDEDSCARGVHRFDLLDKPNGVRDLLGERVADLGRVSRVLGRRRVGVDGHRTRSKRHTVQELAKRRYRARHDGRMERRGDVEPLHRQAIGGQDLRNTVDRVGRSRQHDLRRRVVIRQDDRLPGCLDAGTNVVGIRAHREHRAGGCGGFGHRESTTTRNFDHRREVERTRRIERGDLAEAVTANEFRSHAARLQHGQHRCARGAEGRLRPLCAFEPVDLLRGTHLVERRPRENDVLQAQVGLQVDVRNSIPHTDRGFERHGDVAAHVERLAALPGKEESHLADGRPDPVMHPVGH